MPGPVEVATRLENTKSQGIDKQKEASLHSPIGAPKEAGFEALSEASSVISWR
jgi:hypothetical protein